MPRTYDVPTPDLTGRRVVLTGGSDGIGFELATRFAGAGADLLLPVRNPRKGADAVDRIRARHPGATVTLHELDLSSLASVTALGETLRREGSPVHVLVCNAGVMTPPERQETADGFELQLGTNHLGHAALVGHLLPLLRAGSARVTTQVSISAARGGMHWDDLQWTRRYDGQRAYSQSKIAQGLFALELGRRSRAHGWGLTSTVAHPGIAPTRLLAARPEVGRERDTLGVRVIRALSARGVLVGTVASAPLPAWVAATAPAATTERMHAPRWPGHVGGPPGEQDLYRPLRDEDDARRLWAVTQELTGVALPTA